MPGADGKGTDKAFCCQRLAGKAPLLAMKGTNNKALRGNDCKGKGLCGIVTKTKERTNRPLPKCSLLYPSWRSFITLAIFSAKADLNAFFN